jgi:outer membrane receptor protein involved in Fe transport
VQVGVKNVFNTKPPYDVATSIGYSAYGDLRLASYWLSLKKEF